MQTDNHLLDDLARLATGGLGVLQSAKGEVAARLRDQVERLATDLDLVSREEFDAVKAMAAQARRENEALAARIEACEARFQGRERKRTSPKVGAALKTRATAKSKTTTRAKTTVRAKTRRGRTRKA